MPSFPRLPNRLLGSRAVSVAVGSVAVALGLLLPAAPASASLTHFLQEPASFPFAGIHEPDGLALDQANHFVYVANQSHTILKFDTSGLPKEFSGLSSPELPIPNSNLLHLAVDGSGEIYVADTESASVHKYLATGKPDPTTPEIGSGVLVNPAGAAVDSSGDLYVTSQFEEDNVVDEFNPTGTFIQSFGAGQLSGEANDLAVDSEGNVYVATSNGVLAFEPGGACLQACHPIDSANASAVAVDPGTDHVYVADREPARLTEYDSAAHGFTELGSFGFGVFSACGVQSIAVDGAGGDVYASDLCTNNGNGNIDVFGPAVVIPTLHTAAVSELQPTSVALHGTVNTAGTGAADALSDCHFDYVTEIAFSATGFSDLSSGGEAPCVPAAALIPNDGADHAVSAAISGLEAVTPYRFQLVAENQNGSNESEGKPFTTAGPPSIDLQSVDGIEKTTAILHAKINPFELDTEAHFEYISAADYQANGKSFGGAHPATSTPLQDLGSGLGDQSTEAQLTGLTPGAEYDYRVIAESSAETVTGAAQAFTTVEPALFALQGPTKVTTTTTTLNAYLDPLGLATTYRFEYGTTTAYSQSSPELSAGEANAFGLRSAEVSGLAPGTEYHFRTLASNAAGTADSPDFTFTTPPLSCPNQALREEDNSAALPDCRAYEQVSAAQKAGSGIKLQQPAPSGERSLYTALGSFAGDTSGLLSPTYLARREATGWATDPVNNVPAALGKPVFEELAAANPELTEFLTEPVVAGAANIGQADTAATGTIYQRGPDGSFAPVSPPLTVPDDILYNAWLYGGRLNGTNADLSRLVIGVRGAGFLASEPGFDHLYELLGPAAPPRVLNLDANGNEIPACGDNGGTNIASVLTLGAATSGPLQHRISEDGSRVFFAERSASLPGGCEVFHLFARVGGQSTIDLADPADPAASDPQPNAECTSAACQGSPLHDSLFGGASADGSLVFFTSTAQLTDPATPDNLGADNAGGNNGRPCSETIASGCNLYEYAFGRPAGHHLLDLSAGDSSGAGPQVRSVVASSDDGSRVYFIARGLLTSQPNALGQTAQAGAENLYLANTETGKLAFLAARCSGTEQSGTLGGVARCPGSGDDSGSLSLNYDATPDGRFLVFGTYAQLTPDDQNQAADVYRYDAGTGALLRASVGHDGEDENGNGGGQDATAGLSSTGFGQPPDPRFVSDDGSTIAFATARPLQASAEDGRIDAYEWRQGQVTLISGGRAGRNLAGHPALSSSGRDIFFITDQGLLNSDQDGLNDVYDARIAGGFPNPPPPAIECESPAGCGRALPPPPSPPILGTPGFHHGPEPIGKPCRKGYVRKHHRCVKKVRHQRGKGKKHHHRTKYKRAGAKHGGHR